MEIEKASLDLSVAKGQEASLSNPYYISRPTVTVDLCYS